MVPEAWPRRRPEPQVAQRPEDSVPGEAAQGHDHREPGQERDLAYEGLPVGSFATLLAELATLTRNRIVSAGADERAAFEILSQPTALQARALELVGVSPGSM